MLKQLFLLNIFILFNHLTNVEGSTCVYCGYYNGYDWYCGCGGSCYICGSSYCCSYGCISEEDRVTLIDGTTVEASKVNVGDILNDESVIVEISHAENDDKVEGFYIETTCGNIHLTPRHVIKTKNGWTEAKDVKITDMVYSYNDEECAIENISYDTFDPINLYTDSSTLYVENLYISQYPRLNFKKNVKLLWHDYFNKKYVDVFPTNDEETKEEVELDQIEIENEAFKVPNQRLAFKVPVSSSLDESFNINENRNKLGGGHTA